LAREALGILQSSSASFTAHIRWVLRNFNHSLILESLDIPKYDFACKLRVLGFKL
jgi:hypothetical protein